MIIHSIIPYEIIFKQSEQEIPRTEDMEFDNIKMEVKKYREGQYIIVRLLSTNPTHYLNPKYQPGATIKLT